MESTKQKRSSLQLDKEFCAQLVKWAKTGSSKRYCFKLVDVAIGINVSVSSLSVRIAILCHIGLLDKLQHKSCPGRGTYYKINCSASRLEQFVKGEDTFNKYHTDYVSSQRRKANASRIDAIPKQCPLSFVLGYKSSISNLPGKRKVYISGSLQGK